MRFDLEIAPTNSMRFSFLKEGSFIPNSTIPLIYYKNNSINMFPSDFISADMGYYPNEFSVGGYDIFNGPEILNPKSDTFILTDIVKYSSSTNISMPLFYKHIINEQVHDEAIKIIDYYGMIVNRELYITEIDPISNTTNIYINRQNNIMFVEYASKNNISKSLLNLIPIYEEESWENSLFKNLNAKKYIYVNNVISTSYDGTLYIAYISDTNLFRPPYGNLEDPWSVGVLNTKFNIIKNSKVINYWTPEFYLQDLDYEFRYKLVSDKKCKKLLDNYIKTEYKIARYAMDNVNIYIYDFFTKILKYAFTSNDTLQGTKYKDNVFYAKIKDINLDGVISLPIILGENDVAYATHYTDENYYEYKGIDIKTIFSSRVEYVAIYLMPDVLDTDSAISHALIGNDYGYKTIDDYYTNADKNNLYTVAILTLINPFNENNKDDYIQLRSYGNRILDKLNASKSNVDVIYNDLINGDLSFPTNDTLIATINLSNLINNGKIKYSGDLTNPVFDSYSLGFINKINDILSKNLDASTYPILEIKI